MPLGYCTRPACADAGQQEDKLREALSELVGNLESEPVDHALAPPRSATDTIDLSPMFGGVTAHSERFCPACNAPVGVNHHVCNSCGHLLLKVGVSRSSLRLNLIRSLRGFPGQSLELPAGTSRLTLDPQGLAVVTRQRQRALVEVETGVGATLKVGEYEGFGVHIQPQTAVKLNDMQTIRLGQQLLMVARSPLGTYPRAGVAGRDDVETRLAAPALRRAPWYIHRLLPNGSVGEMLPLIGQMTLGDQQCDLSMRDELVEGCHGTLDASDELHLHPEPEHQLWVQAQAGQTIANASQLWIGDAIYQLEQFDD